MMAKATLRIALIWLSLALGLSSAFAEEVIERFFSDIEVLANGTLDVTETITVNAEGRQIRRGIDREFPTVYRKANGEQVTVSFDVISVKRNGRDENYQISSLSNGERLRIGNADVFLEDGQHTYTIRYRTDRQVGFFEKHDELYWNVTGNGWRLDILKAGARVTLPDGAVVGDTEIYTGRFGERERNAKITRETSRVVRVDGTSELLQGEGLTMVVGWQKGIVQPPTDAEKFWQRFRDNLGIGLAALTALGSFLYFLFAWMRVGRDPPKGVIFPQFHPPEGLGPAGVRYIYKQGFDNRAFAASLVDLAVKKRIKIEDLDGGFAIERQPEATHGGKPVLSKAELAMYRRVPNGYLALDQENQPTVSAMKQALANFLNDEYDGAMFVSNFGWFIFGAIASILGLIAAAFLMPRGEGAMMLFPAGFLGVWWTAILFMGRGVAKGLWSGPGIMARIRALLGMGAMLPFAAAGTLIPYMIFKDMNFSGATLAFVVAALLIGVFLFSFYWLLKAPTPTGRKMLDGIESFRMYLATAEEDRLNKLNPPEKTPELFERYLPYAMALDCENEWNAKFASVLAAAAAAGGAVIGSSPYWYNGGNWGNRGFAENLSNSLSNTVAAASTPPTSDTGFSGGSGGGGGGFSGGGGGGGGGGGW